MIIGDKVKIKTAVSTDKDYHEVRHYGSGVFDFLFDKPRFSLEKKQYSPGIWLSGSPYPYLFEIIEEAIKVNKKIIIETIRDDVIDIISLYAKKHNKNISIFSAIDHQLGGQFKTSTSTPFKSWCKNEIIILHQPLDLTLYKKDGAHQPKYPAWIKKIDTMLEEMASKGSKKDTLFIAESDRLMKILMDKKVKRLIPFYAEGDGALPACKTHNVPILYKRFFNSKKGIVVLTDPEDANAYARRYPEEALGLVVKESKSGAVLTNETIKSGQFSPSEDNTFAYQVEFPKNGPCNNISVKTYAYET
jgi:hypothetical protein